MAHLQGWVGPRFYIATRLERAADHRALAAKLTAATWRLTYDWTTHGSVQCEGPERIREVAWREMEGVRQADVVIVLLPGGRGTHAELGMAIAYGKPVFILGDPGEGFFGSDERTRAFYHAPGVRRVEGSVHTLMWELTGWLHARGVRPCVAARG